jgi:hypothetical protein
MAYPENLVTAAIAAEGLDDKTQCEYIAQMELNAGGADPDLIEDRVKFYKKYKREILEVLFGECFNYCSDTFTEFLTQVYGEYLTRRDFAEIFIFENTDYAKYGRVISYLVSAVFRDIAAQLFLKKRRSITKT